MDKLAFAPLIDLPLGLATVIAFVLHFNMWSRANSADATVDLVSRLPTARVRVVALFVATLSVCWVVNFALWAVLALFLAIGFVSATFVGEGNGAGVLILFSAYVIREWSFGFPQLILGPPIDRHAIQNNTSRHARLIGLRGITVSPLRPSGDADIEGRLMSVVSEDRKLIDLGTNVIVCGTRSGLVCVRPIATDALDAGRHKVRERSGG